MLRSRCVLPFLALYLLLQETFAASLPSRFRDKRELNWQEQEAFSRLSDHSDVGDLSVGDAGEMGGRFMDSRLSQSEAGPLPVQRQDQNQNQYQYNRKAHEKRRKVAPLDSIGGFQMSSFRHRQDEPDVYWNTDRN